MQRKAPFPVAQVIEWAEQLLDVLQYLHTQQPQIIHRDIKPQNIKLTAGGRIMLLDFGIAKGTAAGMTTTGQSVLAYTPNYAPLEQIQHSSPSAPRLDIYALGATLYYLLTAQLPPTALERAGASIQGQPDPLILASQVNPDIPLPLAKLLERSLAMDPGKRQQTATEMRAGLQAAKAGRAAQSNQSTAPVSDTLITSIPASIGATIETIVVKPSSMYHNKSKPINTQRKSSTLTRILLYVGFTNSLMMMMFYNLYLNVITLIRGAIYLVLAVLFLAYLISPKIKILWSILWLSILSFLITSYLTIVYDVYQITLPIGLNIVALIIAGILKISDHKGK